jgi:hypothetical protein
MGKWAPGVEQSERRGRDVGRALAIESVKRRAKANRQIAAWRRYAEREMCGKSAPMRDGTWVVCVRPKGHDHGCETGGEVPCIFDPE